MDREKIRAIIILMQKDYEIHGLHEVVMSKFDITANHEYAVNVLLQGERTTVDQIISNWKWLYNQELTAGDVIDRLTVKIRE